MKFFTKRFNNRKKEEKPNNHTANHKDANDKDAISLLEKHKNGFIDDKSFLCSFSEVKIFYSTPYGDHKDGGSRLFILPDSHNTAFLPVFTSIERIESFFKSAGRVSYLIMEDTFTSLLETTDNINTGNIPVRLGLIIDPEHYGVTVGADALRPTVNMIK